MNTLYLSDAEKRVFDALPASLQEGWSVEKEDATFADTQEKQMMRLSLARLHDGKLLKFRESAETATSVEELVKLFEETDLQGVSEDDLAELFFALGPATLSQFIGLMLPGAKTDDALGGIASLTVIRRSLLAASHS